MGLLDKLAEFISRVTFEKLSSETIQQAKLHIFDSLGAVLAGACTEEGKANADLIRELFSAEQRMNGSPSSSIVHPAPRGVQGSPELQVVQDIVHRPSSHVPVPGFGFSAPLPFALLLSCIAARLTETDDIDIASCTTVGSVVVPAALLLSLKKGATGKELIETAVTGYEIITRLGAAVDGAEIIYRGIWPTYLCAAAGVAAVCSKVLGLTLEQTKNALAIALAMSPGMAGKIKGKLTSRWLTLGCAVQNGLIACLAAARDFAGDQTVLEGPFPSLYGLHLNAQILLDGLGTHFQMGKVNFKPYCSARQAIASIEAFHWLLHTHKIAPEAIDDIEVIVPRQYSQMIDRPGFPDDRLGSITSIRYQLALAAFYEEDLFDVERKTLKNEQRVHAFMQKVHVIPSDPLTAIYPKKWPGRISLRADGKKFEYEVTAPKGDSDHPMTWEDVEIKTKRITRPFFGPSRVEELSKSLKTLESMNKVDTLMNILSPASS